jgi:hypothetical protein
LPIRPIIVIPSLSLFHLESLRPDQEAGPSEADIVIRDHHKRSAAAAAQRRFHHGWRTHHSMKAAGCCCCCSRAARCVVGALGTVVAAGCSSVGSCTSLGRGLEACDQGPSLCRGRERSRAFCDGGRLRILWDVSGLSMFGNCEGGYTYEKRKKMKIAPRMIRPRTSQRAQLLQVLRLHTR